MAHGWYRGLVPNADNTGFDTQRIINEYNIALTVIQEAQNEYIALYTRLYKEVTGRDIELSWVNNPPLKIESDRYKFIWEIRKEKGLPYNETDPVQMEIIKPGEAQV
jgi:hypothetical protein